MKNQIKEVLVVDDNIIILNMLANLLKDNFIVYVAQDLETAEIILRNNNIDYLIVDIHLSKGRKGLELLENSPGDYKHVNIVISSDEEYRNELYDRGLIFLNKMNIRHLLHILKK